MTMFTRFVCGLRLQACRVRENTCTQVKGYVRVHHAAHSSLVGAPPRPLSNTHTKRHDNKDNKRARIRFEHSLFLSSAITRPCFSSTLQPPFFRQRVHRDSRARVLRRREHRVVGELPPRLGRVRRQHQLRRRRVRAREHLRGIRRASGRLLIRYQSMRWPASVF